MPLALFLMLEKMIDTVFGTKIEPTRKFTQDGFQIPVTQIRLEPMIIAQIKTQDKDGYNALQLGVGEKKFIRLKKPQQGRLKGAGINQAPLHFREVRAENVSDFKIGDKISPAQILEAGDLVNVTGVSKGKGFTGVIKRWGFKGGPRTHGQSDRERAPGSIGQGTTPGRVFKGKKMAGRAGGVRKTIKNLQVLELDEKKRLLLIKGLVPGVRSSLLEVAKVGKLKKFTPLLRKGREKVEKVAEVEKVGKEKKVEENNAES